MNNDGLSVIIKQDDRSKNVSCDVVQGRVYTNKHGFEQAQIRLSYGFYAGLALDVRGASLCVVDRFGGTVWEGNVQKIIPGADTVNITAYGGYGSLSNVPYSALWSDTSTARWDVLTEAMVGAAFPEPEKYRMDNNNRLYIAPSKGETFVPGQDNGFWLYRIPQRSRRPITNIRFDYEFLAPAQFDARLPMYADWNLTTGLPPAWSITGNGAVQSGSVSLALPNAEAIGFQMLPTTPITFGGDTGDAYLRITNLRVSTTTVPVTAGQIVADMLDCLVETGGSKVSDCRALIEDGEIDLTDVLYEDDDITDVVGALELLAGDEAWCGQVWEGGVLQFSPLGRCGLKWFVPAASIATGLSNVGIVTGAYACYKDANGETLRTETVRSQLCEEVAGCVNIVHIDVRTTDEATAIRHRDALIANCESELLTGRLVVDRCVCEKWRIRAGDTVCVSNIDPAYVGSVGAFVVGRTEYDLVSDQMILYPNNPTPQLSLLLAQS